MCGGGGNYDVVMMSGCLGDGYGGAFLMRMRGEGGVVAMSRWLRRL